MWVWFDPDTLEMGPCLLFGAEPDERPLSTAHFPVVRHTKRSALGRKYDCLP